MKEFIGVSDIGSVLIGDENWTFAVKNIGGDGITKIRIFESSEEFEQDEWKEEMQYISSAEGIFGIYEYDCSSSALLKCEKQ